MSQAGGQQSAQDVTSLYVITVLTARRAVVVGDTSPPPASSAARHCVKKLRDYTGEPRGNHGSVASDARNSMSVLRSSVPGLSSTPMHDWKPFARTTCGKLWLYYYT